MDDVAKKKAVMLADLVNIVNAASEIGRQIQQSGFEWDEDLYAEVRELREKIVHL